MFNLAAVDNKHQQTQLLFKSRAKLYRFDNNVNEWKERGLGEYKISYNEEYNIYRVVMRREQVTHISVADITIFTGVPKTSNMLKTI